MNRMRFFLITLVVAFSCAATTVQAQSGLPVVTGQTALHIRALHFVASYLSVADARKIIDKAADAGFNTIIIGLPWRNGVKLNSTPWVVPGRLTWTRDDVAKISAYVRRKHMKVIPQIPLLSHQGLLLASKYPDLMYNARTYDPANPRVYELVFPIIDELIALMHPAAIHIGHDEVVGWKQRHFELGLLGKGEAIVPAKLFLDDVKRIHAYLKKKNIETWMWGDMLITHAEFPTMANRPDMNGTFPGYGRVLRNSLPRDIVICDWHYRGGQADFPSLKKMHAEGFRVLGATWRSAEVIKNFSHYAALNGAEGMIASTWFIPGARKNNGVINNWMDLNELILTSGKVFKGDFPDAN